MKEEFKTSVIEALQYYVYCLVDPRSNKFFYIGKGHDNRIFNHANDALNETLSSLKLDIIREIRRKGLKVHITLSDMDLVRARHFWLSLF